MSGVHEEITENQRRPTASVNDTAAVGRLSTTLILLILTCPYVDVIEDSCRAEAQEPASLRNQ